jgi:hypothetical protein
MTREGKDSRDDPGAAFLQIKQAQGMPMLAPDADAEAVEIHSQMTQAREDRLRADAARHAQGRFYMFEAASKITKQHGLDENKFAREMQRCAALPDGHPHKLTVRDHDNLLPVGPGAGNSMAHVVFPSDVNAWLSATGAGYQWRIDWEGHWRDELAGHMTPENFDHYAKDLIRRVDFDVNHDAIRAELLADEAKRRECFQNKTPFPLASGGTRITEWANKQTWTPEDGAYLACGFIPPRLTFVDRHLGRDTPAQFMRLCGNVDSIAPIEPGLILKDWREQWERASDIPERQKPATFIAWCRQRGIDTCWLDHVAGPGDTTEPAAPERKVKASTQQDTAIIQWLKARGIDLLNMPKAPLGNKPWPLREELMSDLNYSKPTVCKAFTRLRKEKLMKDA